MKNLNLNIMFTESGTAYVKCYNAVYSNKLNDKTIQGKKFTNKDSVNEEVKLYEKIFDYLYLYTESNLIFLN